MNETPSAPSAPTRVQRATAFVDRYFFWLGLAALAIGLAVEELAVLAPYTPYQVALSMFVGGINVRWQAFLKAVREPGHYAWSLLYIYLLMPASSWLLAYIFFPGEPGLATGYIFAAVLPCGITGAIWTLIARGNMALNLSLVTLTTLASGLTTPWLLRLWAGAFIDINVWNLTKSLVLTVVIPVIIGLVVHERWPERARSWQAPLSLEVKLTMLVIVAAFTADALPDLKQMPGLERVILVAAAFLHLMLGHLGAYALARWMRIDHEDAVALAYASGVRNSVAGAAIATTQMGAQVALPLLMVLVLSQPVGSLTLMIFGRTKAREAVRSAAPSLPDR